MLFLQQGWVFLSFWVPPTKLWLQSVPVAALGHAGLAKLAVAELALSLPVGQETRSCSRAVA